INFLPEVEELASQELHHCAGTCNLQKVIAFPFMGSSGVEDTFGRRVRQEREARGWTQADLAERVAALGLHLHPSAIAKIELRDVDRPRAIRLDEADVIAMAFGLSTFEMTETRDHRIRWVGNRMRVWLGRLIDFLGEDGRYIAGDLEALIVGADSKEAKRLTELLMPSEFNSLVEDTIDKAIELRDGLHHPSRKPSLDWDKSPQ
ncbi:multiprotein-bridging factor 1 family protein, partial [Micromonospora sp. NPDC047620]|uniref:helix-turn-helix domain-containing protein n=1 Tax=Micromonospora sp. NPDC047620 TaxID=3364251 RepID=UPI00371BBE06